MPVGATVRAYRPGDESALVALWNAALPTDPLDVVTLAARVLADPNFEPSSLLVLEGPRPAGACAGMRSAAPTGRVAADVPAAMGAGPGTPLLGFVLALTRRVPLEPGEGLETDCGWITAFAVHPAARRQGAGRQLLAEACASLTRRGCTRVEVSPYAPGYFWPGVDQAAHAGAVPFLRALGFTALYEAVAMERSLSAYRPPDEAIAARARLEGEGVRFGPLTPDLVIPLIAWNGRVFHADWARAVRAAVARRLPWSRTLVARAADGGILGFAQYGCYDRAADRFGPFGVDPAARGRGIGRVLLHECLQGMQRDDLRCAWFLWTGERSPAGALYRAAGFHVARRFLLFRRSLEVPVVG